MENWTRRGIFTQSNKKSNEWKRLFLVQSIFPIIDFQPACELLLSLIQEFPKAKFNSFKADAEGSRTFEQLGKQANLQIEVIVKASSNRPYSRMNTLMQRSEKTLILLTSKINW